MTVPGVNAFLAIQQIIAPICGDEDFCQKAEEDPEYLNYRLEIAAMNDMYSKDSPWKNFVPLIRLLASQYREIAYGLSSSIPSDEWVERALYIADCVNARLFTNMGYLHPQAFQRAWRSAVMQLVLSPEEQGEEQRAVLQYLLPSGSHSFCLNARDHLLKEDQSYFCSAIRSQEIRHPASFGMNLLLSKFSLESPQFKAEAVFTAIHANHSTLALQWVESVDLAPTLEEIEEYLFQSLSRLETKLSNKLVSLVPPTKQDIFQKVLLKLSPTDFSSQTMLYLAIYDNCEELSFMLLDQIGFCSRTLNNALLLACARGLCFVAMKLAKLPDMDDYGRGEGVYIAARYDPQRTLKILSSYSHSCFCRGAAMCCRAELNDTESVQMLWDSGPTLVQHQNEVFFQAVKYGNADLLQLRLKSDLPLSDAQRIEAIRIAKEQKRSQAIIDLLMPSCTSKLGNVACFPNYPSPSDTPYYFKTITAQQLMCPSEEEKSHDPLVGPQLQSWTPFSLPEIASHRPSKC